MRTVAVKQAKMADAGEASLAGKAKEVYANAHQQNKSTHSLCHNCGVDARCRRRDFSEQAWTVLLLWNEITPAAVDQPICNDCYREMRDILIDRTDEIEEAMQKSDEVAKIKQQLSHLAS